MAKKSHERNKQRDADSPPEMVQACALAIVAAGGPAKLADKLNISRAAVAMWKIVPVKRVPDVERVTGISRHVLRPDYWPAPTAKPANRRQAGMEATA